MDTCGFFWSKNLFGQKTPKVVQKRRASQYVVHPKQAGANLSIDVHTQPQKNFVPPTPTATGTKRQMREIINSSNHHFHQNDFIFVETAKANTKRSTTREETNNTYEKEKEHEILKQRTRIINPRLPVIRDDRPDTSSRRRQKHRNHSQDHEQGRVRAPVRPDLSLWYDSIDIRDHRNEVEDHPPAKTKYSYEQDKQTSSDNRKTKETDKRSKETVEHVESNVTQETYRTLTSVYRSKPNLMESFDDLLINRHGDPDRVIREVVENHVEKAYRRIDLIKRNFYKNKKKYLFHIASDF